MIPKRLIDISVCLFSGLIILSASCNRSPGTADETSVVKTPVTITSISFKSISETVNLPAISSFLKKNIIKSGTNGSVESISINLGDFVKTNQLLFMIKTKEAAAIQNNSSNDTNLAFNGIIKILSPKEGVISSISHQNGDFVQEGDELAVISEQNSLVFILDTPFEFVKYVEKNSSCKIQLPDNQIINGNITGKLPEMDTQAQTVRYVIKPVFTGQLPANLNAVVDIVKSSRTKAAILPKPAVLSNETQTEFWVMKLINDTTAIKVPVTIGFENSEEVEITGPEFLQTDRIILTGSYGLPDTARVIIK